VPQVVPVEVIEKLDELARANNINRSALIGIACARILKTGL
jgi:predicted transcriptional regulator